MRPLEKKEKLRKQQKSFTHQLKKKNKRAVGEDQEGCEQTSQQNFPDKFEGEENAQENVWSAQAYEHEALHGLEQHKRTSLHAELAIITS